MKLIVQQPSGENKMNRKTRTHESHILCIYVCMEWYVCVYNESNSNENNSLILIRFWHTNRMWLSPINSTVYEQNIQLHMRTYHITLCKTNNIYWK